MEVWVTAEQSKSSNASLEKPQQLLSHKHTLSESVCDRDPLAEPSSSSCWQLGGRGRENDAQVSNIAINWCWALSFFCFFFFSGICVLGNVLLLHVYLLVRFWIFGCAVGGMGVLLQPEQDKQHDEINKAGVCCNLANRHRETIDTL